MNWNRSTGRVLQRVSIITAGTGIVLLLLGTSTATVIASWTPTYTGVVYAPGGVTCTLGSGANTAIVPQGFALSTGKATFDLKSNATGAAAAHQGHYCIAYADTGLNQSSYTCGVGCTSGTHTVNWNWNLTYSWKQESICPHGTQSTGTLPNVAHVEVRVNGSIYDQTSGTVVATGFHSLDTPTDVTTCSGAMTRVTGGPSGTLPYQLQLSGSFTSGHSYHFQGWIDIAIAAIYCEVGNPNPCSSATSADYFDAEVDMGSSGNAGVLNSVVLVA